MVGPVSMAITHPLSQLTGARLGNLAEAVPEEVISCIHFRRYNTVIFGGAARNAVAAGLICMFSPPTSR